MDIKVILQQIGFSTNEADVYLAALELGLSSAQEIAKKAAIKRTTAYSVLEHLVQRGVLSKTKVKDKTRFIVEPPARLFTMVSNLQSELSKLLPELEAIYNAKPTKPKIIFYEGDDAIKNVYEDTLNEKPDEILEWNTDKYFEHPISRDYIKRRVELSIRARRMAGRSSIWHKRGKNKDKTELAETIIVPQDKFSPEIEVNIYNNKVAFINYVEKMSVIIESPAIAKAMKQAYELSWLGAKVIEVK